MVKKAETSVGTNPNWNFSFGPGTPAAASAAVSARTDIEEPARHSLQDLIDLPQQAQPPIDNCTISASQTTTENTRSISISFSYSKNT